MLLSLVSSHLSAFTYYIPLCIAYHPFNICFCTDCFTHNAIECNARLSKPCTCSCVCSNAGLSR